MQTNSCGATPPARSDAGPAAQFHDQLYQILEVYPSIRPLDTSHFDAGDGPGQGQEFDWDRVVECYLRIPDKTEELARLWIELCDWRTHVNAVGRTGHYLARRVAAELGYPCRCGDCAGAAVIPFERRLEWPKRAAWSASALVVAAAVAILAWPSPATDVPGGAVEAVQTDDPDAHRTSAHPAAPAAQRLEHAPAAQPPELARPPVRYKHEQVGDTTVFRPIRDGATPLSAWSPAIVERGPVKLRKGDAVRIRNVKPSADSTPRDVMLTVTEVATDQAGSSAPVHVERVFEIDHESATDRPLPVGDPNVRIRDVKFAF